MVQVQMLSRLFSFGSRNGARQAAVALYRTIVSQARKPVFYRDFGVPDTLDGRFDMIILHAFLVSRRLKAENSNHSKDLNQALFDLMFSDMDNSLREIGVGDLSVGKKVKAMAQAYYGRIDAYDRGLAGDGETLSAALKRNLYASGDVRQEQVAAVATYIRRADAMLASQPADKLLAGHVDFPVAESTLPG